MGAVENFMSVRNFCGSYFFFFLPCPMGTVKYLVNMVMVDEAVEERKVHEAVDTG